MRLPLGYVAVTRQSSAESIYTTTDCQ